MFDKEMLLSYLGKKTLQDLNDHHVFEQLDID